MTPGAALAALDRLLKAKGNPSVLRRQVFVDGVATNHDVAVHIFDRGYEPHELVGSIIQGDRDVTLSPSDIDAAVWLAGLAPVTGENSDRRIPMKGDRIRIGNRFMAVQAADPVWLAGVLVRINLQVRG